MNLSISVFCFALLCLFKYTHSWITEMMLQANPSSIFSETIILSCFYSCFFFPHKSPLSENLFSLSNMFWYVWYECICIFYNIVDINQCFCWITYLNLLVKFMCSVNFYINYTNLPHKHSDTYWNAIFA